ncbi:MAG: sugar phosphate isomerase/epimerase family protein [Candidatus Latescibacterota bacterium]
MKMGRRTFIRSSAAAGALGTGVLIAQAMTVPDPPRRAVLKPSCQENVAPGNSLTEKLDFIEKYGYVGLEVGGGNLAVRVTELQNALRGRSVKISAICAGFKGCIISPEQAERDEGMKTMKEILTAAGALGSTGLIIVPAFSRQNQLEHSKSREMLIERLRELGEHAVSVKSRILLEPLNRKEAYFLRQVADAAAICRDVASPGICCMGDFWHMSWEETNDLGALLSAGNYLHHMHIASRKNRKMPGEDEGDNYVEGFRALKMLGYQDYVSLECGSVGDKTVTVPAAVKLMREQWGKA